MKERYEEVAVEVIEILADDVIATSGEPVQVMNSNSELPFINIGL